MGLGLMALALSLNPLALAGPALMHALIVRLSGRSDAGGASLGAEGFDAWKARTNALWPRLGR